MVVNILWISVWMVFMVILSEANVTWNVEKQISAYGEDLELFCISDDYEMSSTMSKRWYQGQTLLTFNDETDDITKYNATVESRGFKLIIKNLTENDVNETYWCAYGFTRSQKLPLLTKDVFKKDLPEHIGELEDSDSKIAVILGIVIGAFIVILISVFAILYKRGRLEMVTKMCFNGQPQNAPDGCEELTEVLFNRCGHKNFNHIELTDVEKFNDDGQYTDNYNKETDGLLQDSIHNLNITGEKNYVSGVDARPFNTGRNHDKDNSQLGRRSDSDSSLIGAGNNNISDISTCGPRSITDESCQASWSGEQNGNTKNGSEETLPKAMHRQPEILSDSPKDVESVATNADTNPAALKIKTVVSESTSVQSVDNVSHNFEKCIGIGQLPHSPDNVIRYERSDVVDLSSVNSELNDTELKKEVSSENTIVKASEQKSTFSSTPSLHVDSMFSGGNTNSSGPSYIYLLRWEMSGDDRPGRGRIEYWENPHYGHKSNVLTDLETGKVLLKSPKKYMNDNVVYLVPDKQNNGIEPFMQIILEQLEDEIDIQSLLKSGATIYDLDTFEIIDQQRPQLNPAHSGQLLSEQPHHMPLPHEQNQSDNGIDNNTENNEVQNDDQFNNLSLGSFENDN